MTLDQIAEGDVLSYWFDTGAMGASVTFARVVRLGKVRILVRDESGREGWKDPSFFHRKLSDRDVTELRADGVEI